MSRTLYLTAVLVAFALVAPLAGAQVAPLYTFDTPNAADGGGFGIALASVGDLDGDGVPEVAVSAPDEDTDINASVADAGQVHVYSGATGAFVRTYASPNPETDAYFGDAILPAGDRNGDGTPDFYVPASRETVGGLGNVGRVYLLSGADGAELASFTSPNPAVEGEFGFDLGRLGDLTGDGVGEVGVSARGETVNGLPQAGRLYVFDGVADTLVLAITSPDPLLEAGFGYTSDDAGDIDGDGTPDIVTGAPFRDTAVGDLVGRLYIVSGADGSAIRTIDSPNAVTLGGFGRWAAGLGDVTGDGVPDVATGANGEPDQGTYLGRAYVISGATGEAVVELQSPDEQLFGFFGELVEAVPDLDGDGLDDLVVSARAEDAGAEMTVLTGRVYLFSSTGVLLGTLAPPVPDADGVQYFGYGIAPLDDLDGDGLPEIGVGAFGENPPEGPANSGRAYVFPSGLTVSAEPAPEASALGLSIHPNPARLSATVAFRLPSAGPARVEVFDVLGRSVAVLADGDRVTGEHVVRAPLAGLPAGPYVVRLRTADRTETQRITVIR